MEISAEETVGIQGLSPDLAAVIARRRRKRQGQPVEQEEQPVISSPVRESGIAESGQQPEYTLPPVSDAPTIARSFQTRQLSGEAMPVTSSLRKEQAEEDVIEIPPGSQNEAMTELSVVSRSFVSRPLSRKAVLFVVVGFVVMIGGVGVSQEVVSIRTSNSLATATARAGVATNIAYGNAVAHANATATAQAAATAAALQQTYDRATNGTPTVADPLSSDNGNFSLYSDSQGNTCAFSGGALHITVPVYTWLPCEIKTGSFNNFALQVQVNIVEGDGGDSGGIFFGDGSSGSYYEMLINSAGNYYLYLYGGNGRYTVLESGLSPAVATGVGQANVMTVIMNNGVSYLYVNSQFVMSDTLSGYSQGWVGLIAYSPRQTAATDVAFSNMKLWTL
jgi:hypothetical protein